MTQALVLAALGTGFTFGMTALGACVVFLFRRQNSPGLHRVMLGFAAGVMLAASVWSLLIPSIEKARELHLAGWLPAAGGSALGIAFLLFFCMPTGSNIDTSRNFGGTKRQHIAPISSTCPG